jgi:hypothetical protein
MLSEQHPCESFGTPSGAHRASAHKDVLCLYTSARRDGASYSLCEMWFSLDEAKEIVRVLERAIAENEEYQASRPLETNPAAALMSATFKALNKPADGAIKTTTDDEEG